MTDHPGCSTFHSAVELIGRRWNGVVLDALLRGTLRFSELRTAIPQVTPAMLSRRLKELERAGVLVREVVGTRPVEVRYTLTEAGRALAPVLGAIADWGTTWDGGRQR